MIEPKKLRPLTEWKPFRGPQELFHQIPAYEALFGGAKGPGKTDSLLREGLRQVQNKNYRAVIFRRTYPRLGEIIDRSFKYFRSLSASYSDKDIQLKLPAWTFPSGAKYCFGHVHAEQDKYNYQGKEFHYMGFDQLEEFTESQYLFLLAQNRTTDEKIWCYTRATANPGGIGHGWVKKRFIDSLKKFPNEVKFFKRFQDEDAECGESDPLALSRAFIPATVFDNPAILKNDPDYIKRLEQLPDSDRRALLLGDWDVFAGQFFKMWRQASHVVEKKVHPGYEKFLSLDYGYGAPSSVHWWMVEPDGCLHAYRELYQEGLNYEELAARIKDMTSRDERLSYCVADPSIWNDREHHKGSVKGESGAETIQNIWSGYCALLQADNSRVTGWGRMRIRLSGENPMMTYSPNCKNAIRTIPALIHDELNVEDVDTDGEDHAGDDGRYACMSRPAPAEAAAAKPTGMTDYNMERMEAQQAVYAEAL